MMMRLWQKCSFSCSSRITFAVILLLCWLLMPTSGALARPYERSSMGYDGDPGDGVLTPDPELVRDLITKTTLLDQDTSLGFRTVNPRLATVWTRPVIRGLGSPFIWFFPPVFLAGGGFEPTTAMMAYPPEGRWHP